MKDNQALSMLHALSQETRLHIVRYLVQRGAEGASAGKIGDVVGATSSRASFHLSALEQAGVVTSERQSRKIIYRANVENLGGLVSFLLNDCCDGHPDILACCKMEHHRASVS
ncbi:MAG: metalloregulator ArsR/SmtB family transcription factor [Pseudomonadota bacterium]